MRRPQASPMNTPDRERARDAGLRLLNRLTYAAAFAAVAGVGLFSAVSAATIPGATSTTASSNASTSNAASSTSSSASSQSSSASSSTSSISSSSGVSSSSSGTTHAV